MSLPNAPQGIDTLLRLKGLKNVSGRRKVTPGMEDLQQMDNTNFNLEGTANPGEEYPQPMPENGAFSNRGNDVRANMVNVSPEEEAIDWTSIGRQLGQAALPTPQTPPIETVQVDMQEGIPPVTASQEERLKWLSPFGAGPGGVMPQQAGIEQESQAIEPIYQQKNEENIRPNWMKSFGGGPGGVIPQQSTGEQAPLLAGPITPQQPKIESEQDQAEFQRKIDEAVKNPYEHSVFGSALQVSQNPEEISKFEEITGINYEPQIAQQVATYEDALKGIEDSLNGIYTQQGELAEGIKQRILNNQATDADKYYIGMALLMPLIIGGVFGKEAGLGALSGGAKGFSDVLGNRQKGIREDEQALMDINKERANTQGKLAEIGAKRAEFEPTLRKNLPKSPNEHLIGKKEIEWVDPKTGEKKRGIRIKPGLVAQEEYVTSKEGVTDMLKNANDLAKEKDAVDEITGLTTDIIEIVSQLEDQGEQNAFTKGFIEFMEKKSPSALSALTRDITLNGKKVNSGVILRNKLGLLTNAYGKAKELGQTDRAMQQHVVKIFDNPAATLLSAQSSIDQMIEVLNLAQVGMVNSAKNKGFYPEFLESEYQKKDKDLFDKLNKRETKKIVHERKKSSYKSE